MRTKATIKLERKTTTTNEYHQTKYQISYDDMMIYNSNFDVCIVDENKNNKWMNEYAMVTLNRKKEKKGKRERERESDKRFIHI